MEQKKGYLYLFSAFTLAGTSVIAARFVSLPVFTFIAASLFLALLILIPACFITRSRIRFRDLDWPRIILQAVFGIILFRFFLLTGLDFTSSAEAGVITGATPAITILLARLFLKENINKQRIAGIICTIAGILLVHKTLTSIGAFQTGHSTGNLMVLCAAACESSFNIFSRVNTLKLKKTGGIHPLVQTAYVVGVAFAISAFAAVFEKPAILLAALSLTEWAGLMWYGFFVTALAFICWYAGIKHCRANTAAVFSSMMPLTSLLLSVLFLNETMTLQQWAGAALIIIGMVIVSVKPIKAKSPAPPSVDQQHF